MVLIENENYYGVIKSPDFCVLYLCVLQINYNLEDILHILIRAHVYLPGFLSEFCL
jgi:hypothetical protein